MLPRLAVWMTGAALVLPACGDDCGDGEYRDAEICFKEHVLEFEAEAAAPYSLLAADFDGDGAHDILVTGAADGRITTALRRGDGEGRLGDARDLGVSGCSAYPVAADLDADGLADLLFPTCTDGVLWYRGGGGGDLLPPLEIPVGVDLITTAVTDVDGDGRRDLLVLGNMSESPALGVVRQRPDGGFAPPQVQTARVPGLDDFRPAAFVAGRLRRDGPLQLVLAELDRPSGLARAEVREGALQPPVALPTGLRPGALALGDLDDDDTLDVLVLDTAPDALVALRGPDLSEGSPTPLGARPNFLALAHLDGDGSLDLVLHHGARLGLWRGVGDGRFTAAVQLEFAADVTALALPDLNSDGRGDIVAGLFPDHGLAIRLSGP